MIVNKKNKPRAQVKVPIRWKPILTEKGCIYSHAVYESVAKYIANKDINLETDLNFHRMHEETWTMNVDIDPVQHKALMAMNGKVSLNVRLALRKYFIRDWWKLWYIKKFKGEDSVDYWDFIRKNNRENYDVLYLFDETWPYIQKSRGING